MVYIPEVECAPKVHVMVLNLIVDVPQEIHIQFDSESETNVKQHYKKRSEIALNIQNTKRISDYKTTKPMF